MHYIEEIQQAERESQQAIQAARDDARVALELAKSDSLKERALLEQELADARATTLAAQAQTLEQEHTKRLAQAAHEAEVLTQGARTKLPKAVVSIEQLMFS